MQDKNSIDIAVLQEQVSNIQKDVTKILENHLPHIDMRLNNIENKLAYYAGGIVVLSAIVQVAISFYK